MTQGTNNVSWKWVAGILVTALLMGIAAWASSLQGRINMIEISKAEKADVERIYQRLGIIETDVKERLRRDGRVPRYSPD